MRRRAFLGASMASMLSVAGCTSNEAEHPTATTPESDSTTTKTETATQTASPTQTTQADAVLEYSITTGKNPDAVPDDIAGLADEGNGRRRVGYRWMVVTFEVVEGQLNMQDVWFNSRAETPARFYTLDHATADLELGVQSRGSIKSGGKGIALYQIPDDVSTYSWNLGLLDQRVAGPNTDQPHEPAGPTDTVTVEYTVTSGESLSVVPDEYQNRLRDGHKWALVEFNVVDGQLSMSEVWFKSKLETESRLYDLDHTTSRIELGVLSRGSIKPGHSGRALYQVSEDATSFTWNLDELSQTVSAQK